MTRILNLPNAQRRAIDVVKEVAVEKNCRPFLVGGPVRDLLLGRSAIDVDLTLEEGSSSLARALAKRVDGRVRSYPQFLTYKITADGFPEIDIATARREKYRKPGALPSVEAGRLTDDLLRRDFSINAIALDLLDGSIHDPTSGERDLNERLIRVLHDRSFVDDPTRIFRAVRLAGRLGFKLAEHTEDLLHKAILDGALTTVSRERLWRELFLAMDEPAAASILAELNTHGAVASLLGRPASKEGVKALETVGQVVAQSDLDRHVMFTGVLLRGGDASPAQLEGSGFSQKRAKSALQIARDTGRVEKALADSSSDRQRFRLFKNVSAELLTIVSAELPHERENVERYEQFKAFKLPLRGNDLEVPAGPHVARALERAREAVFSGEIPPDRAREFARELAIKYLEEKA